MRRNKRKTIKMSLLMLILLLGIGFAVLTANLKINGTVDVTKSSWDVHFENVQVTQGSVTATTAPTSDDTTTTEMTYAVSFTQPGDFYEFTVDMANDGSINAMVNLVSNTIYESDGTTPKNLPSYLRSSVTYVDGVTIAQNQELLHNTSEKIKVRVEFRTDIDSSDLPSSADTIVFKFKGDYKQADDDAVPVGLDFSTASWDDIINAYSNNPLSLRRTMENGTTKEVQLDLDNDGTPETTSHLRIANISTPAECSQEGFSQSACGLVIEFADVIISHRMNPYVSGDTTTTGVNNKGGWEYSDMRAYLNSTTYAYESIDYSSTGIYNALPSELKSKIINTTIVSGHNNNDSANFITTDKLYLLDAKEVYGDSFNAISNTANNYERQLDYYEIQGVTITNYSGAIKQINGANSYWWLRSPGLYNYEGFFDVDGNGDWYSLYRSVVGLGVSPAFRIG